MAYHTKWCARFLLASMLAVGSQSALAELSLNSSPTIGEFRAVLDGPGLRLENLQFQRGAKGQYGIFVSDVSSDVMNRGTILGISDGIYLSTGNSNAILGPNTSDKYTYNTQLQYADPDLTAITANAIYDPVIIEFDLIPEGDQVNFLLVFGSEEYPEYVCSKFNDVFGLFVSGPGIAGTRNAAFVPGSSDSIAVNNVNNGLRGSAADGTACNLNNSIHFFDNGNGGGAAGTQLDGFTRPLTASLGGLQAGQRYKIKLALADAGDQAYDSAAFFKWLTSTSSDKVDLELEAIASTSNPARNGTLELRYKITNTSSTATRLVETGIDLPDGVSLLSDDGGGLFDGEDGIWRVGDLDAGESKTITLRLNVGEALSYTIPAEIQYAFNEDPDSTPYNRLSIPTEDDTAIIVLSPVHNNSPVISNAGSAASTEISYPENARTLIVNLDAQDSDGDVEGSGLDWIISGGADRGRFTLDVNGGLRFINPPDYEFPLDSDTNNRYEVEVKVCDRVAECDVQLIDVIVTDVTDEPDTTPNSPPTILNHGSAATAALTYDENAITAVVDLNAEDVDGETEGNGLVWIISGGSDERLFAFDSRGGLHFINSPNFEKPADSNADNQYDVEVRVCDSSEHCDIQLLNITVADVEEAPDVADNQPPSILNNSSAPIATLTADENLSVPVVDLEARDEEGETEGAGLVWVISGGEDESQFTLDSRGGLRFIAPPDYEAPTDSDTDNHYEVEVKVCDSVNACDVQVITVEVVDLAEDFDNDGIPAGVEIALGSDPNNADSDGDGIDDGIEIGLDHDNPTDTDSDGVPNVLDDDDDGDSILTKDENYNGGSPADDDTDGDGVPDYLEPDDDGDSVLTINENYNGGSPLDDDTDRDDTPDYRDSDDDNDGLFTKDEQPDPNGDGDPADAIDTEGDGLVDYLDFNNATAPTDDDDGDGIDNQTEIELGMDPNNGDSDNDGVPDGDELDENGNPRDSDNDGIPDFLDLDDDNDGILNVDENYNGGPLTDDDTDNDGKPDYLDDDDDNDSIMTRLEDYNGNGAQDDDSDGDGIPDYLDTDDDGDGVITWLENYNGALPLDDDTDGDGIPDYLDTDDDGDGLLTINESPDPNQNGNPDDAVDTDQDGKMNFIDADDDDDGIPTIDEMADPNGDGDPADAVDADFDELPKYLDNVFTPFVRLKTRVMLQGPYLWTTGRMRTRLAELGYLPPEQPYSSLESSFGYGSVGNVAPFGYNGDGVLAESVLQAEGDDAVVDWILVEIRDSADPAKVLTAAAVVVQADGDVVVPETGEDNLFLSGVDTGDYYVAIRHRNHLGVMTATPVPLRSVEPLTYDFTDPALAVYGENARSVQFTKDALMWSGDLNNSNSIISEGPGSDLTVILGSVLVAPANIETNANYPLDGYYASDLNMDGKTVYSGPDNDANLLIGNVLLHPGNSDHISNYAVQGTVP